MGKSSWKKWLCAAALIGTVIVHKEAGRNTDLVKSIPGTVCAEAEIIMENETAGTVNTAAKNTVVYENCYGDQLSGESREIYNMLSAKWSSGRTADFTYRLTKPQVFRAYGVVQGSKVYWDKENCSNYRKLADGIASMMQRVSDAYIFDHPETFWLYNISYNFRISFTQESEDILLGKITSIEITGNECYSGAKKETAAFSKAVAAAVTKIRASLPQRADRYDQVRAIHNYICEQVSYGENEYAHTAAGVFHKSTKEAVCEGYARALKILCGRFGIPCALIVGKARNISGSWEEHLWNYVQMDDGVWYLVDATWDDQETYLYPTYLLAGSRSTGFADLSIEQERVVYRDFSMTGGTGFAVPKLSKQAYQWEKHDWKEISESAATCQSCGVIEKKCVLCGKVKKEILPRAAHRYGKYRSDKNATCTKDGTKTAVCRFGCGKEKTVKDKGSKKGHHYSKKWTVDREATCIREGSKSHHCTVCGARKDVTAIRKLTPSMTLNVSKLVLQTGQMTEAVKVSGLGKGDRVVSWKSSAPRIVQVTGQGKITAGKRTGNAVITITLKSGLRKTLRVCVQKQAVRTAEIAGISRSICLKKGKTMRLKPQLVPVTSTEQVSYQSSDKKVAAVSTKGKITAKKKGTAVIVVQSGGVKVKCKVVVM